MVREMGNDAIAVLRRFNRSFTPRIGVLDESLFTVDGSTMSYSGPMLKQPANDGSQPPPVEVGEGTIRATCE